MSSASVYCISDLAGEHDGAMDNMAGASPATTILREVRPDYLSYMVVAGLAPAMSPANTHYPKSTDSIMQHNPLPQLNHAVIPNHQHREAGQRDMNITPHSHN